MLQLVVYIQSMQLGGAAKLDSKFTEVHKELKKKKKRDYCSGSSIILAQEGYR